MQMQMGSDRGDDGAELQEKVVTIRRVAKVVKGGRHLTFNAMVVVGDGHGRVGAGLGKGAAVPDAVRKGTVIARREMASVPLKDGTVAHMVKAHFGASNVVIRPARAGTGIKAGGAVRAVMEAVGIRDVVAKALGSRNPINIVKATLVGLHQLQGRIEGEGEGPPMRATLPPAPERRGPIRREGGGPRGGRDRDRGRRPPPRGPEGPPGAEAITPPGPARSSEPVASAGAPAPTANEPTTVADAPPASVEAESTAHEPAAHEAPDGPEEVRDG